MRPIKIYTASKRIHADKLKSFENPDVHFNARWLDTANLSTNSTKPASKWQVENFDDIRACDFVLLYGEPGDLMQGALIEVGYAMAWDRPIYVVMDFTDTVPNPWMLMGEHAAYKVMRRNSVADVIMEVVRARTPKDNKLDC